jgi:hypothetical protein
MTALKPGDKVADGCVVVPVEPTGEMKKAAVDKMMASRLGGEYFWPNYARDVYAAMLAALDTGET